MSDILEKLIDLHKQATTERSHYYVASCCREAMNEIAMLRTQLARLQNALQNTCKTPLDEAPDTSPK